MLKDKKKTNKTESNTVPPVAENEVSFTMTFDEVLSMVQILSFSKDVFKQMAMNSLKEGDEKTGEAYAARSNLSSILYSKFRVLANIGEPTSREVH